MNKLRGKSYCHRFFFVSLWSLDNAKEILKNRENDSSRAFKISSRCGINSDWVSIARFPNKNFLFPFQYIVLLILVFLLELSAGTLAYIYERNIEEELNMTLSDTFTQNYAVSERHTKAIDLMQQNFVCCGAIRFEEYRQSVWLRSKRKDLIRPIDDRVVPDSCCFSLSLGCGNSDHPSNIPYTVRMRRNL